MTRILGVVTDVAHCDDPTHPTGLWPSGPTRARNHVGGHGRAQALADGPGERSSECAGSVLRCSTPSASGGCGAIYSKARLPFVSHAVVDGTLVTGQNPGSAKETATKVVEVLARR